MTQRTRRFLQSLAFLYTVVLSLLAITMLPSGSSWQLSFGVVCAAFLLVTFPWWLLFPEQELRDVFADVVPAEEAEARHAGVARGIGVAIGVAGINALSWFLPAWFAIDPNRTDLSARIFAFVTLIAVPSVIVGAFVTVVLNTSPQLRKST